MSQCKIETKSAHQNYSSSIKIIGKRSSQHKQNGSCYQQICFEPQCHIYCPQLQSKPQNYIPMAKKIYVEGNFIAIIDLLDNLWFISQLFASMVNVSVLVARKVRTIALGENQCIIGNNKKNPILLNWGAKKILDVSELETVKLNQKVVRSCSNFFNAYTLNCNKQDKFLYSLIKKVDNSNKLYQIKTQTSEEKDPKSFKKLKKKTISPSNPFPISEIAPTYSIVAFPTHQTLLTGTKIIGLSVGKHHCLCWDAVGSLYSWGNRSIALGYEQLPHQKITTKPKMVKRLKKGGQFVTMGFAGTHYSIVLCSQGDVYEWGIKRLANQINQQLIFEPRILKVGQTGSKIIMIKGKKDQIACLNSKHQLYVWGQKAATFLPFQLQSQLRFKNDHIYEPFLVPYLEEQNIIDFDIGEEFIAIVTSKSGPLIMTQEQKAYWNDMLINIKTKLKLSTAVKTQAAQEVKNPINQFKFRSSQCQTQILPLQLNPSSTFLSNVQKSYRERNLKKEYFRSLKNQNKFFIDLLKGQKSQQFQLKTNRQQNNTVIKKLLSQRKQNAICSLSLSKSPFYNTMQTISYRKKQMSQILNQKHLPTKTLDQNRFDQITKKLSNSILNSNSNPNFNLTLNSTDQKKYHKLLSVKRQSALQQKLSQDGNRSMKNSKLHQFKKLHIQSYQSRLQKVQRKKQSMQQSFSQKISKKLQQNSIQYRMNRHEKIVQAKIYEKNRNMLKQTLQAYLIKLYFIRFLTCPIEQARRVKIQQFAKSLHLSRIQKNLRKIFIKARISHRMKKLKKANFVRFAILCHVFKQYVKNRRLKKAQKMRKLIAEQLYKNVLKQKIRFGLSKTHLNIRKLQKFREWMVLTKIERIKCLKILWKNHLLSFMKLSNQTDAMTICKSQQNCTFESLYKQKIAANPMLKLQTFLDKSPIFQLRYEYFQSIIFLFRKQNKIKSQKILKRMKSERRKQRIKFSGEGEVLSYNSTNLQNASDLLPYSLHYNSLIRPKSMEINIPENMKKSQKWIQEERNIFDRCLRQILQSHEKNMLKQRRKYDIQLAYFIRQKYDSLAQKRWKYIIQYNKIKPSPYKKKKQKELYRIFDLIGMQKILNEDCLPEKYLMLEEAIKKRDAPPAPNPYIVFGINQFKDVFKKYYEIVSVRGKQIRKNFV